ncbi:MAG: dienelactone hydrolase family protein [Polyangiaceae bacterium]|nr:dienelactone hydrolase family protein [Polyangiaceae bacterium]
MRRRPFLVLLATAGCATRRVTPVTGEGENGSRDAAVDRYTARLDGGATVGIHVPGRRSSELDGVLALHSAMGRTPGVLAHADALAAAGFGVYAVDLFGGRTATTPEEARALRDTANAHPDRIAQIIREGYAGLATDPRIRARRRFLLGWSYGAAWATTAAGDLSGVAGVVAIYGQNLSGNEPLSRRVSCPVLLIGATEDTEPSPERLRSVATERAALGLPTEVTIFEGGHGFMEPRHPGYSTAASRAAMNAIQQFLAAAEPESP